MFGKDKYSSENPKQALYQEPVYTTDNSEMGNYGPESGVAPNNATNLIGGKFKSVEDLARAYAELERKYGLQARELGELRQIADEYSQHKQNCERTRQQLDEFQGFIQGLSEKYNSDNYLKNREFREILKAAYSAYGNKLDVDSLVSMLEGYMNTRSSLAKKAEAFKSEADSATDLLGYVANSQSKFKGPKKRLTEMTPEELDKALDELM